MSHLIKNHRNLSKIGLGSEVLDSVPQLLHQTRELLGWWLTILRVHIDLDISRCSQLGYIEVGLGASCGIGVHLGRGCCVL